MTLRYDIWGPDVLVANLMESNGVPGRITVSEKTVEALQHVPGVQFQHLGHVDVCVYIDLTGRDSGSTWGASLGSPLFTRQFGVNLDSTSLPPPHCPAAPPR